MKVGFVGYDWGDVEDASKQFAKALRHFGVYSTTVKTGSYVIHILTDKKITVREAKKIAKDYTMF